MPTSPSKLSSAGGSSHLTYRPDIDGLRAIAVLAVIFFHAELGFSGGFVGVDVFFVISGYLITSLILKDFERDQFRILDFWARRIRRILPALAVVGFTCLVAGWFLFLPIDFQSLGESLFAQALLVSNFYFWLHASYFDQTAEMMPLLHTWSLAVEEQFYLTFPFLLAALIKLPRPVLCFILGALGAISFGLCVYCSYFHASINFYLLPTRAWELLLGALPATLPVHRELARWLGESLSWAGILAILYAVFFYDSGTRFPGIAAIAPCLGTALIIWTNSSTTTSVGRLLALPPVVFVGLISYSLYLWHWPLLAFAKYLTLGPLSSTERALLLGASAILAVASWRFVETPFRKRVIFRSRVGILSFGGVTAFVLMLAGFVVFKGQGFPSRLSPQALTYANGANDQGFRINTGFDDALKGNFIGLGSGDKKLPIKLFVWGDSQAMTTLSILDTLCKEHAVRGFAATHFATAPLLNFECDSAYSLNEQTIPYSNAVVDFIKKNQIGDVVIVGWWGGYSDDLPKFRRALLETLSVLTDSGVRVWLLRQVPSPAVNVPRALTLAVLRGQNPEDLVFPLTYYHEKSRLVDPIFREVLPSGTTVLDPAKILFNSKGQLTVAEKGNALYFDGDHLSVIGAAKLRPLFEPIFEGMEAGNHESKK